MLEDNFQKVYTKFKLALYAKMLSSMDNEREDSLSIQEVVCMEIIDSLDDPTVNEFAELSRLSSPNATYRVNRMVKKGYVRKEQDQKDRREMHLIPTEKYAQNYGSTFDYIDVVCQRIRNRFSEEETDILDRILNVVNEELMHEFESLDRISRNSAETVQD